jgi:hypothetical protein
VDLVDDLLDDVVGLRRLSVGGSSRSTVDMGVRSKLDKMEMFVSVKPPMVAAAVAVAW